MKDLRDIPEVLARSRSCIFKGLPTEYANRWPVRFTDAIRPGQDLSLVGWRFFHTLLTNEALNPGIYHSHLSAEVRRCANIIGDRSIGIMPNEPARRMYWSAAWSAAEGAAFTSTWCAKENVAWCVVRSIAKSEAWCAAWWTSWAMAYRVGETIAWTETEIAAWNSEKEAAWILIADELVALITNAPVRREEK